jgi:hypothetical protein
MGSACACGTGTAMIPATLIAVAAANTFPVAITGDCMGNLLPFSVSLATMNGSKINDFIRAIAMVRISLENTGVYEKYKKSYLALTKKTHLCCCFYVLKMHYRQKCMNGSMTNIKKVGRAIKHYTGDEFSPTTLFSELPDVVDTPELKENYSIR